MLCPIATMSKSQGIFLGSRFNSLVVIPLSSMFDTICVFVTKCVIFPFSSLSISYGDCNSSNIAPSSKAPSISSFKAVISSLTLLYIIVVFFALHLIAVLTQSIDTFPPPTTTTFLSFKSGYLSSPILPRNSTAEIILFASLPGIVSFLSL